MREERHIAIVKERRRLREHRAEVGDVADALALVDKPKPQVADFIWYNGLDAIATHALAMGQRVHIEYGNEIWSAGRKRHGQKRR